VSNELPQGWTATALSTVAQQIDYGYTASADELADGPKFLRITDLQRGSVDWSRVPRCACDPDSLVRFAIAPGDLVIARTGATTGKSFLVRTVPEPSVFASYLIRIRPALSVDSRYLAAFTQSPDYWEQITEVKKGTAQPGANASILGAIELPLAPLNEQRRIVAKLEDLLARSRRAKDALDAIPPLLEKLRQSILAAAFRGDLTADWRAKNPDVEPAEELLKRIRIERRKKWEEAEFAKLRAKGKAPADDRWKAKYKEPEPVDASELPELPEGWCWATWELATWELTVGHVGSTTDHYRELGVPFIRSQNVRPMRFSREGLRWISGEFDRTLDKSRLYGGEVLIVRVGANLGDCCAYPVDAGIANCANVVVGRPTPQIIGDYLAATTNTPLARVHIDALTSGSAQGVLNVGSAAQLPVPLAPRREQEQILRRLAQLMSQADTIAAKAGQTAGMTSTLHAATLRAAFRGELVEQDPNDEPASVMLKRLAAERQTAQDVPAAAKRSPRQKARA
jgi:type I restriction enzyme, S subunit